MNYLAFMGALEHSHFDYLENTLKEYDIGSYIVSAEVSSTSHEATKGQHFHFLVEMTDQDYTRFSKRVFIDKFKLRGRAVKGLPRQYGKVKQIENLEQMKRYTVKDGNFRTNLTDTEIQELVENSFQKDEKKKIQDELMEILLEQFHNLEWFDVRYGIKDSLDYDECSRNYIKITRFVITWYLDKDMRPPPPSTYKSICINFIHKLKKYVNEDKAVILIALMDIRNPFSR